MLKIFFLVLIVIHGLIHSMGFLKAFQLANINELTQPISRTTGVLWLIACVLFLAVALLLLIKKEWWWMPAIAAIVISQILIFIAWQDAKFGTLANLIILLVVILGIGVWSFNIQIHNEKNQMLSQGKSIENTIITEQMLVDLPFPVQKWLINIGMVGKEEITTVYLKQKGQMKLKPDQGDWLNSQAEQYITVHKPSYLWTTNVSMFPIINVVGRDLFMNGHGKILMKVASLIPVANVSNNDKTDQSSLHRFLLELAWYPSFALSQYVTWETIDDYSARATMTYNGVSGSADFFFNEDWDLIKCSAFRYKDNDENAEPIECVAEIKSYNIVDGLKVPSIIDISWMLDEGKFTWYKLEAYDFMFNTI